jgi:soluble lytic murein transglycosylase
LGRKVPTTKKGRESSSFGRRQRRRGVVLSIVLITLAALPLLFMAPETVQRFIYPLKYEKTILEASEEHDVEPTLVAAVIREESRFDPTGDYRGPNTNIRMGTWYLNYLQNRYEGDERLVLAAYNSGEGRVDAWTSEEGFDINSDIPFEETRDYVEDVVEAEENYEELYGRDLDRRQG